MKETTVTSTLIAFLKFITQHAFLSTSRRKQKHRIGGCIYSKGLQTVSRPRLRPRALQLRDVFLFFPS